MKQLGHSLDAMTVSGRLQYSRGRCLLQLPEQESAILVKCPGLGVTLLRDVRGIRVTSGKTMVDVHCELTGRFLKDVVVPPFDAVFGDISELVLYSEDDTPIRVDLGTIQELSAFELEECEYFERRDNDSSLRERYLRDRKAW